MNYTFELEYDGVYYEIDCEYKADQDTQSHEFGVRVLESVIPVSWVASVDGALITITDENLKAKIWRECDSYADRAR